LREELAFPRKICGDEQVFFLHCEEAAQVALGEIELAHPRQHHGLQHAWLVRDIGLTPVFIPSAGRVTLIVVWLVVYPAPLLVAIRAAISSISKNDSYRILLNAFLTLF
jgi:hypothetical protein